MSLADLGACLVRALPPETAHTVTLKALAAGLGPRAAAPDDPVLKTRLAGLDLPSPVGLAAGFDKDAKAPDALLAAGFGFVEIGTVTPRPQAGNARPRLFRLTADRAVINRMGFNNDGHAAARARLEAGRADRAGVVGVNLGANKDSADRIADYKAGLAAFWELADYFTINVSSPNTPGLRDLQGAGSLEALLGGVAETRMKLAGDGPSAPVFLKIAPDLDDDDAVRIVEAARAAGMEGLIVSNTTTARPHTLQSPEAGQQGGLSGAPLFARSTRLLKLCRQAAGPDVALIGVGGISSADQAWEKIRAGADAVQLYTALVYRGPALVREIKAGLADRMKAEGFASVSEAVGR